MHLFSTVLRRTTLATAALSVCSAQAIEFDTGTPDLTLRWDNTVKASTMYRLKNADPALADSLNAAGAAQAINFNAGDQNFRKSGVVSERLDLLSEFDAVYQRDFGLRISGAAWYDRMYHRSTEAVDDPTIGQDPFNQFAAETRRIAGQKAELMDAFVFGAADLGNAGKLSARLGQHTLLYGESLFFGDNAVAAAQGPVDVAKLLASPNAQFKEIALPVPQLSTQWQVQPNVELGAYVQFKWRETRLPPAGSYFSTFNTPWGGTGPEFLNLPAVLGPVAGPYAATPGANVEPKNSGQFGLELKWRVDETELGFYFARYHDKAGESYTRLNPADRADSRWFYVFPENTRVAGASVSQTLGQFNVSAEASVRDNMPLVTSTIVYFGPGDAPRPENPTGHTAHLNVSALGSFGPNFLAQESSVVAEIAWNRAMTVHDPAHELDPGRTRDATAMQVVYTPTYRQVLNGLDINVPVGLNYTLDGRSSVTSWGPAGTGSANIGLEGNYLQVWQFALNYTRFIGKDIPAFDASQNRLGNGNALGDRDFVSLNIRRTF